MDLTFLFARGGSAAGETKLDYTRRARVARRTHCVEFHQIRCNLWISLYTNPIPESAKFCSESIQFDPKSSIFALLFDPVVHEFYS